MKKNNAHTKRMEQLICNAMIALLNEKDFYKITVQDILDTAEIQRATFYRYYKDKYEVVESINSFLVNHFVDVYIKTFYFNGCIDIRDLEFLEVKYKILIQKLLFFEKEHIHFLDDIQEAFIKKYKQQFPDSTDLEAFMAAQGSISMIIWCTNNSTSLSEVTKFINSDAQLRWISNFYNVPFQQLSNFLTKNQISNLPTSNQES